MLGTNAFGWGYFGENSAAFVASLVVPSRTARNTLLRQ